MRYEYEFERVANPYGGSAYQDRVRERALQGWRLVQVLVEQPAAMVTEYVLVLERPAGAATE